MAADRYTHGHHSSVVAQHASRTVENCANFLIPHLQEDFALLDVGCGPGSITRGFAKYVKSVTGVDNSESVIAQAQKALGETGSEGIEFQTASVYDLPFQDATFDVVYAHQVLQHLSEPVAALREMRRVCKAGGLIGVKDAIYSTMRGSPALPGIDKWRDVYMATARQNKAEPEAGLFLKRWLREAELKDVDYTTSTVTYSSANEVARKNWAESWAERTIHSFGTQALEYGIAKEPELQEVASAWKQWAADPESVFLFVNGECYIRGDCVTSIVLKAGNVEGEAENELGYFAGSATNQSGRRSHLAAPDCLALQEVIHEALRQTQITGLDVDAVESCADGKILDDSLEATAFARAYRPQGTLNVDDTAPLGIISAKSGVGNQLEAAGLSQILKVILGSRAAAFHPTPHLRIVNPHIDIEMCERNAILAGESLDFRLPSTYTGSSLSR
ncbi:unnamed protein product [Symbiodinium necroappetens]|uniref:Ketosynthase family 3 (KS3) domain-containing protein n=1 Tax=Symbiodinium necroappetens TaxID=1628268 RepID=A0A812XMT8_9DINO|nr:unnamed protein product [Symbiodinium necroappetens]